MKKSLLFAVLSLLIRSSVAWSETPTNLEKIVVIANKTSQSNQQVPNTVDVIDMQDMHLEQSLTISDVLQSVSGLILSEKSVMGDDVDIRMRGSDRDEVLVLYDGVPIEGNGESRAFFINYLPIEFIDRIEIIKGAQSVLYGSNAVGGVINIISKKKFSDDIKSSFGLEYTTSNSFRETAAMQFGSERTSIFFGIIRDDSNILNNFNDQSQTTGLHASVVHDISDAIKFTIGFDGVYGEQNLTYDQINTFTNAGTLNSYVVVDDDIQRKLGWFQSQAQLDIQFTDRFKTHFQIAGNYLKETLLNSNVGDNPVDENQSPLTPNSQLYISHSFRIFTDVFSQYRLIESENIKNDFQLGFNFINDHLDFINDSFPGDVGAGLPSNSSYPDIGEESDRQNYSLYFQNLFYWKNLCLTAGARLDHNTTFGNEWSPRFALSYFLEKTGTTFRASYSEGFHAPTIAEFFDATVGGSVTSLAIKLNQETTKSYEAGIEQSLLNKKLKLRSTFFYIDYDQLLDIVEVIDSAQSWGIENDVSFNLISKTKLGGNYTYNHTRNDETGQELTLRPKHSVSAYVQIEPIKNLTIKTEMRFISKRKNPENISLTIGDFPVQTFNSGGQTSSYLDGHVAINAQVKYKWDKPFARLNSVDFYANVKNVLNERYENNFGYPAANFQITLGSKINY